MPLIAKLLILVSRSREKRQRDDSAREDEPAAKRIDWSGTGARKLDAEEEIMSEDVRQRLKTEGEDVEAAETRIKCWI